MRDVLVSENVSGEAMDALRKSFDVAFEPELWKSPEELNHRVGDYQALIVRNQTKVDAALCRAGAKLKVIGRAGVGLDNVDVDAASERGIVVCFTPEQNSLSVAELTVGLMLSLARRIPQAHASTRAGRWERQVFTGTELYGKTLGLIGLGRIGLLTAVRAAAFGMTILVADPQMRPDSLPIIHSRATLVSLDELLRQSDYISIHVPQTPQTTNLLNDARLAQMKPSAFLINTSRGGVIDESAVLRALKEKRLSGAALDVRAKEPPLPGELERMENVVLLPHIAAFTVEGQERVVDCVCRDVAAILQGALGQFREFSNAPSRCPRSTPRRSSSMIPSVEDAPASTSLRQRVGSKLRHLILNGQLRSGARIHQQRLARQFAVSQSVLREALVQMQFTGLIDSVENLGMFVAEIDSKKLLEAYPVREMLEGLAARLCCQTASIANIRELQGIAQKIYALGVAGRDGERADLDRRFHDRLFEISNNEVLKRVAGAYHIVRMMVLKNMPHEQVRDDHLQIVVAIQRNDPDLAERLARQHVVSAREMIEQQISSNQQGRGFRAGDDSCLEELP